MSKFWLAAVAVFLAGMLFTGVVDNEFYFFSAYVILQGMIMATAWNMLGGFTGYVNFGSAGFFAVGAYTSITLHQAFALPLPLLILGGGMICGLIGLAAGYLTLRLKGIYFAIANNWEYVGGARGVYILTPKDTFIFDSYVELLFMVMVIIVIAAVAVARYLSQSRIGQGLTAIRDDELAAECMGVPTLRLKLISATSMGIFMGMAGAPYPFFVTFVDPISAFSLFIAVNAIAMPLIGGTKVWYGPVIGALILGLTQEITTVTISSELNLLIVGVVLIGFITLAPGGIVGLVQDFRQRRRTDGRSAA